MDPSSPSVVTPSLPPLAFGVLANTKREIKCFKRVTSQVTLSYMTISKGKLVLSIREIQQALLMKLLDVSVDRRYRSSSRYCFYLLVTCYHEDRLSYEREYWICFGSSILLSKGNELSVCSVDRYCQGIVFLGG